MSVVKEMQYDIKYNQSTHCQSFPEQRFEKAKVWFSQWLKELSVNYTSITNWFDVLDCMFAKCNKNLLKSMKKDKVPSFGDLFDGLCLDKFVTKFVTYGFRKAWCVKELVIVSFFCFPTHCYPCNHVVIKNIIKMRKKDERR